MSSPPVVALYRVTTLHHLLLRENLPDQQVRQQLYIISVLSLVLRIMVRNSLCLFVFMVLTTFHIAVCIFWHFIRKVLSFQIRRLSFISRPLCFLYPKFVLHITNKTPLYISYEARYLVWLLWFLSNLMSTCSRSYCSHWTLIDKTNCQLVLI